MQALFEVANIEGCVRLPAADPPFVSPADFATLLTERLYRSVEQFCFFLYEAAGGIPQPPWDRHPQPL